MTTTPTKKINNVTYFKKLTIELYALYVLNTYVKFRFNHILFNIRLINLFFKYNFKIQKFKI